MWEQTRGSREAKAERGGEQEDERGAKASLTNGGEKMRCSPADEAAIMMASRPHDILLDTTRASSSPALLPCPVI